MVADQRTVRKVSLYNSGQRAAFVKVLCYPGVASTMIETCILSLIKHLPSAVDNDSIPLPLDQASITPSELILQPQHMKVRRD